MDTLSYVLSGVGLVLLLGLGYLYHVYTMAQRDLLAAQERAERLASDNVALTAAVDAKSKVIQGLQAAAAKDYHDRTKEVEERVAKATTSELISNVKSMFDEVD